MANDIVGSLARFSFYVADHRRATLYYYANANGVVAALAGPSESIRWVFDPQPSEADFLALYPGAVLVSQIS